MSNKILGGKSVELGIQFDNKRYNFVEIVEAWSEQVETLPDYKKDAILKRIKIFEEYDQSVWNWIGAIIEDFKALDNSYNELKQKNIKLQKYCRQMGGNPELINWVKQSEI